MGRRLLGMWRGRGFLHGHSRGKGIARGRLTARSLSALFAGLCLVALMVGFGPRLRPSWAWGMEQLAALAQHGAYWMVRAGTLQDADSDRAVSLLRASLPRRWDGGDLTEPNSEWTTVVRSWVYALTGYDFSEPTSFLEAELRGYATVLQQMGGGVQAVAGEGVFQTNSPTGPPASISVSPQPGSPDLGDVLSQPSAAPEPTQPTSDVPPTSLPVSPELPRVDEPGLEGIDPTGQSHQTPATFEETWARAPWGEQPLIAVVHTHASEMYRTDTFGPASGHEYHLFGTEETGIVRVGERLAQTLTETYGIPAIHSKALHDTPCHSCAYVESRKTVEALIRQYPSLRFIVDVHRDGAEELSMLAALGGEDVAQVALVVGRPTNQARHPRWEENNQTAQRVGAILRERYPGVFRRTIYLNGVYNQDLHPGAMLVEIGNYYDHEAYALRSAELLAGVLAEALYEDVFDQRPPVTFWSTEPAGRTTLN